MTDTRHITTASERDLLERAVERLLLLLDQFDSDPDLEDNGDAEAEPDNEPPLGWAESEARLSSYGLLLASDIDLEDQCEDEGAQCEDESAEEGI
jgi:hypothetical protein